MIIRNLKNLNMKKLKVSGNSMYPTIKDGEIITVYKIDPNNIRINDIIVYRKFENHLTIHRVVAINHLNENHFYCITKGDNNINNDNYYVYNHEILGVVKND